MTKVVVKKAICPVSTVAELLSDTWTMLIIHNLLDSKKGLRFCELERALVGISTRTLTLKLKKLEEQKLVEKTSEGYSLTKIGSQLKSVIKAMRVFGEKI